MNQYIYWDNSNTYHGSKLFEVIANSLKDADAAFHATLGYDPLVVGTVGVQIIKPEV